MNRAELNTQIYPLCNMVQPNQICLLLLFNSLYLYRHINIHAMCIHTMSHTRTTCIYPLIRNNRQGLREEVLLFYWRTYAKYV